MKFEVELSPELAERIDQVAETMAIGPEEAIAYLLGAMTAGIVSKQRPQDAQEMRRFQLTQGAGLLLQGTLMSHEDPDKVWQLFQDFYARLEAMIFAEELTPEDFHSPRGESGEGEPGD